jgi:GPH family glycoside/pentoside/hexuronide:cation symporter
MTMRDRKISLPIKFAFGTGQVAEAIKSNSLEFFLLFYYVQVLHLDPILAGTALLLALVVDGITDPIMGAISDNFHSRLGRRHPFMYASAIPFGLMLYLLFSPPNGLSDISLFIWMTFFTISLRVMMTIFLVPYLALGAELTENYSDRTALVAIRNMFSFIAAIILSMVAFRVFFKATDAYPQGQLNPDAYPGFALTFAIVSVIAILISTRGTQSQIPYLHTTKSEGAVFSGSFTDFYKYFYSGLREVLKNRAFLSIFLVSITFFILSGLQRALVLHMNTYFWAIETAKMQYLFYAFFGSTVLVIPFVKHIMNWLDKRRTMYLGMAVILTSYVLPTILRLIGLFPDNGSSLLLPILIFSQITTGFGMAIMVVGMGSIMADIADDQELRSGKRQEGLIFSFVTFAMKATSGAGHFFAGLALSLISFPTEKNVQPGDIPEDLLFKLGMVYGPSVLVFGLLCFYFFSFYNITRESHEQTLETLRVRREGTSDLTQKNEQKTTGIESRSKSE